MRVRIITRLLPAIILGLAGTATVADVVTIPVGQQTRQAEITTPVSGQTKSAVTDRFGEPSHKSGPVGDPAIYTWEYPDFVVYFENDRVIHSVVKFTPKVSRAE